MFVNKLIIFNIKLSKDCCIKEFKNDKSKVYSHSDGITITSGKLKFRRTRI